MTTDDIFTNPSNINDGNLVKQDDDYNVRCVHCCRLTPSKKRLTRKYLEPSSLSYYTNIKKKDLCLSLTNKNISSHSSTIQLPIETLVLTAARELAVSMNSPTPVWERQKKFFTLCASPKQLTEKQITRLKRMINTYPSLLKSRCSRLGEFVPDACTPLHASAYAGNYDALVLLCKKEQTALNARDLQGRTALHIASERGHVRIVQYLKTVMTSQNQLEPIGYNAPTDLTGKTPLGRASVSMEISAKSNQQLLRKELFAKGDVSVCGQLTPPKERSNLTNMKFKDNNSGDKPIHQQLKFGYAEMPGYRIHMEDAICHEYPIYPPHDLYPEEIGFFAVFDGHGDGGVASRFLANNFLKCVYDTEIWQKYGTYNANYNTRTDSIVESLKQSCINVDKMLKDHLKNTESCLQGGSTGIIAVISKESIIVANVGDSRCILVQKANDTHEYLTESKNLGVIKQLEKKTLKCLNNSPDLIKSISSLTINDNENENVPLNLTANRGIQDRGEIDNANNTEKILFQEESEIDTNIESILQQTVIPLSIDHKPNLPEEQSRIERAGYRVISQTFEEPFVRAELINSQLVHFHDRHEIKIYKIYKNENERIAVSRAFGDFDYKSNDLFSFEKQAIICLPDIRIHKREYERDQYLILACDGVFDVMSNEDVSSFVCEKVHTLQSADPSVLNRPILPHVGDALLEECLDRGSSDNMSVLIIAFPVEKNKSNKMASGIFSGAKTLHFTK